MSESHDWDKVLGVYAKLERGEALDLNADMRELLGRVAQDVALSPEDADRALRSPPGAETLVRELRRRIFEGSRRLSRALVDSARRKKTGDVTGARAVLDAVLAVEVVPLYRKQVEIALDYVDEPEG
ncbi:DUSAM domain-containing protein [Archangium primigenium]|uniref:DUSAM domain-containing protein n=1 Tax=[Archangium] primigenium TaxID=2792470 RepID=UPI00195C5A5F|nr:DUSAM domain-containing protein [Archangium primigenium]MBM7112240.1 DUF2379 family protein [Archangium primigenium]